MLRVAYIHPRRRPPRSLTRANVRCAKAEDALERMRNGLAAATTDTREQIERRIGQIIAANIAGLIDAAVTTRKGKLTITWQRNQDAITAAASCDGIYALATNLPGRLTAGQVLRLYKDQQIVNVATAT